MDRSTIAAIATPFGSGGIGIIRISGPEAFSTGASVFRRFQTFDGSIPSKIPASAFESHKLYYGQFINPDSEQVIDEILITFMRAPATYTREDVVEIHSHGGPYVVRTILDILIKAGLRLAEPGEFTKRAFLNGRIDLTQAEAVIDIIQAKSQEALAIANSQIQGELKTSIQKVRNRLLDFQSQIEVLIDFSEDVEKTPGIEEIHLQNLTEINHCLLQLIDSYNQSIFYREGQKIVIAGAPNVGKSSLMNRLLQKDRSIVTDIPGTTRDSIEDTFWINGIPIMITDTAGIQNTNDPIEIIGISKTQQHLSDADLVLFVIEADRDLTKTEIALFEQLKRKRLLIVVNKIDRVPNGYLPRIPAPADTLETRLISALYGTGIDELRTAIIQSCLNVASNFNLAAVPNLRHVQALKKCQEICAAALLTVHDHSAIALIAIDIRDAIRQLDEIMGITVTEDLLERIFGNFCIGK